MENERTNDNRNQSGSKTVASAYLKKISGQWFPEGLRIECHVHATEVDNVAESIVQHSGEFDYDLIVMCSHGRGKALHLILGSMAQKVIIYEERLEVGSPGRLPIGITPERMLTGCRAARNQLLKDVMRDYGYLEHMGMGIPRKIVKSMQAHIEH